MFYGGNAGVLNGFPLEVKLVPTLITFQRKLKTEFFRKASESLWIVYVLCLVCACVCVCYTVFIVMSILFVSH